MKITYTIMLSIASFLALTDNLFSQTVEVQGQLKVTTVNTNIAPTEILSLNASGIIEKTNTSSLFSANAWNITGNAGTHPSLNFIGTTDDFDIVFRRNNIKAGFISSLHTALGENALNAVTLSAYNNTAFGRNALWNNTDGGQNTAVGDNASVFNTIGSFNTAIGYDALRLNENGERNTAVGRYALKDNVSGSDNIAVGVNAMLSGSGNHNIVIGVSAFNSSSADSTIAIGYRSLASNTFGRRNTTNGFESLKSNTTGNDNSAFGFLSLFSNTEGNSNIAFGNFSLFNNIAGVSNTAIGEKALYLNNSGNKNLGLGYRALHNLTSGSNNIGIGYEAIVPSSTANNQLSIGNLIYGTGLTGVSGAGNIGIGLANPSNKLHVFASSDPLKLEGVQTGLTTDDLMSIDANGVVRKLTTSSLVGGSDFTTDYLYNNGNNSIFDQSGGNFGIGTPTPTNMLHVSASVDPLKLEGLQAGTATDSVLTFNTTTNLVKRRSVNSIIGSLDDTKDYWTNNLNNSIFNQASGNVIIGATSEGTVSSATSGSSTAQQKAKLTSDGGDALFNNITVGKGGGQVVSNTALGNQTLYDNLTTGTFNTAVGSLALTNNTSGDYNTALGYVALSANTTSSNNTAVGYAALAANTGSVNNAFGVSSLLNNTSGTQNTAIGTSTLFENIDGDFNTALGNNALQNNETGSNNVALGYQALLGNTSGSRNIAIGYQASVPSNTSDNQLSIGNVIYGTGITGTSGAGNIGIGISAPTQKLHVSGNGLFTGTVTASCGVLICSDKRYKKEIIPVPDALNRLTQINGVNYIFRSNEFPNYNFNDKLQIGVIAQEVETIFPELVNTDKDGFKSVDYPKITAVLIEAIKELKKENETTKSALTDLKVSLENLKSIIANKSIAQNK